MKPRIAPIVAVLAAALAPPACRLHADEPARDFLREPAPERDKRMKWWREARFGMFIHWGAYAVPAGEYQGKRAKGLGEWIMHSARIPVAEYEKFVARFDPVKFDADAWAALAEQAGMKYVVITSKHHDGFCLWDSKVSTYDIVDATPYKKDVLKLLAEACKAHGLRLCFYHSIMDWHHPQARGGSFPTYREQYLKPQLKELLTGYGDVGVLWFDGEWIREWTEQQGKDLYNYVRSLKPDLIVNNRVGKGRKGMEGMSKGGGYAGDFGTPEQQIPATGLPGVDWESCMTMNDTWGYKHFDRNWKPAAALIRNLVDVASKGGNYLLNVGPTAEGLIPEPSVERLQAIGKWMKTNGEAIHGTAASPFGREAWGRYTCKPGRIYAHVFDWPAGGRIDVPPIEGKITRATLLADPDRKGLEVTCGGKAVTIALPGAAPDPVASVVALDVEGPLTPRPRRC